jgi:hypothetical protein
LPDKEKPRGSMSDIVFSGAPPPPLPKPVPAPEIRRDSMGRKISMTGLEALKAHQFKSGQSGNPGANRKRQREHANALVIHLLKTGKLQPSDTIADFLNLLGDMEARSLRRETPERFLKGLRKLNKIWERRLEEQLSAAVYPSADPQHGAEEPNMGRKV